MPDISIGRRLGTRRHAVNRRRFLMALAANGASAQPANRRMLRGWREPNCGCCTGWVQHMRAAGLRGDDNR